MRPVAPISCDGSRWHAMLVVVGLLQDRWGDGVKKPQMDGLHSGLFIEWADESALSHKIKAVDQQLQEPYPPR